MIPEDNETQIARQSEGGARDAGTYWHRVRGNMTGEQRLAKGVWS